MAGWRGNEGMQKPTMGGKKTVTTIYRQGWGSVSEVLYWANRLEIALVEGYNRLKRSSREGAEGKESADLILLIHPTQAKLPGRASTVEKAQKCVWWGILKIFWAQQDLKITKTISKEDRPVQTRRVRFSVGQLPEEGAKEGLPGGASICKTWPVLVWCNFVTDSCFKDPCK